MPNDPLRILILGGTAEARLLAARLEGDARFSPLTSLAGVTLKPAKISGDIRSGGFGGVEGLAAFLKEKHIALMVDATHPFAAQISDHAAKASAETGIACLRLERAPWGKQPGDDWVHAQDVAAAAQSIPQGGRAFVTVGRQEVMPFFARENIRIVARMIEPPDVQIPDHVEVLLARPPFSPEHERALLKERRITVLVSKNSGGDATYAKIEVARELGLPVIMIARPGRMQAATALSVDEMMGLIEQTLD